MKNTAHPNDRTPQLSWGCFTLAHGSEGSGKANPKLRVKLPKGSI